MSILKKSLAIGSAVAAIAFANGAAFAATDLGSVNLTADGSGGYSANFSFNADQFDANNNFDVSYTVTLPFSGLTSFQTGITGGTLSSVTFGGNALTIDTTTNSAAFNYQPYAKNTYTFEIVGKGDDSGIVTGSVSLTPAVPEPATWAMMIGGVGIAGGALRRRKRTTVTFATA